MARGRRLCNELEDDPPRLRALKGEHGELFAAVIHVETGNARPLPVEEVPVLLPVGGVDDQEVFFAVQSIQVRVIKGTPVCVGIMVYCARPGSKAAALLVRTF